MARTSTGNGTRTVSNSDTDTMTTTAGMEQTTAVGGESGSAGNPLESVGQAVAAGTQHAEQKGQEFLSQTKAVAGQTFDRARNQAREQLNQQKDRAAETLGTLTQTLQSTTQQFRDSNLDYLADSADALVGQVERLNTYLRDSDIEDLTRDAEAFARRNPALFLGGALVLGVAVGRFLKSSGSAATMTGANGSNETALVPVTQSRPMTTTTPASRFAVETEDLDTSALPSERPITAHNYVPGIGVTQTNPTV